MIQVFDDGTQMVTDDATGAVVSYTDTNGNSYGPARDVVGDYLELFLGSAAQEIRRAFNPPAPSAQAVAPQQPQGFNVGKVALFAAIGFGAYKLLSKRA